MRGESFSSRGVGTAAPHVHDVSGAAYDAEVSTALYRRYRPETFAEVIGQEHVTEPLMAALESGRVTHAYLFSGPRGCGKTSSARIFARCLNCAQGPTPTPCGECDSCRELARDGSGSLDVVEIDAASHNGVDDARELRERAAFAPARDRYKIFILDEAHMVTAQGFNALLKLVEEPPEHVKFIFATTEPEKVIGTIRSRTHHYPFRLVPPPTLTGFLDRLCHEEGIAVGPGVLPMVVRAGGGSVRDSLSVLDQLMAGAVDGAVDYERAAALLGFTSGTLLDDAVAALAGHDGAALFQVVDRTVASGHDPRRFVEDLLQRLRDLVIVALAGDAAGPALGSVPADQLDRMTMQAQHLGAAGASRAADLTNTALSEMTGATSPRLQLELLCARLLIAGAHAHAPAPAARNTADKGDGRPPPAASAPVERRANDGAPAAPAERVNDDTVGSSRAPSPDEEPETSPRAAAAPVAERAPSAPRDDTSVPTPAAAGVPKEVPASATQSGPPPGGGAPGSAPGRPRNPAAEAARRASAALRARSRRDGATAGEPAPAVPRGAGAAEPRATDPGGQVGAGSRADVRTAAGGPVAPGVRPESLRDSQPSPESAPSAGSPEPDPASAERVTIAASRDAARTAESESSAPQREPAEREDPRSRPLDPPENAAENGSDDSRARSSESVASVDSPAPDPSAPASTAPADARPAVGNSPATDTPPPVPAPAGDSPSAPASAPIDTALVRRRWNEVLDTLAQIRRASWVLVAHSATVGQVTGDEMQLIFETPGLCQAFASGHHDDNVVAAISETLGIRVRVVGVTAAVAGPGTSAGSARSPRTPMSPESPGTAPADIDDEGEDEVSEDDMSISESESYGIPVIQRILGGEIVEDNAV